MKIIYALSPSTGKVQPTVVSPVEPQPGTTIYKHDHSAGKVVKTEK